MKRFIRGYIYWRDWGIGIEIQFDRRWTIDITIGPLVIEIGHEHQYDTDWDDWDE